MSICPAVYFSEYALAYLIESVKQINNKYFVITPQVSKVGDPDWDKITNPRYVNIPYTDYLKTDVYNLRYENKTSDEEINLKLLGKSKFAGWFDLYSKAFYEELCPVQDNWQGYGPWDHYSMMIADFVKHHGVDFQQYLLQGETIWMYPSGPLLKNGANGFTQYYRDRLKTNDIPNQRKDFDLKMNGYINVGIQNLIDKKIIKTL
jgi:hypothetical protein